MSNEILSELLSEYDKKKLKAELDLDARKAELYKKLPRLQEIEDELKGIMRNGFTIIHKYNNTWDIEQVKENWEVSMLPYLS